MAGKTKEEIVEVMLPLLQDPNAPQQEFYSVNGKNYILQRGVTLKVPKSLYEVIRNGQEQEMKAYRFAQDRKVKEPTK